MPSVQKTSPLIGSALAAASTRPSARSATLTATSGVVAAKLRVPHRGSTSHSRAAPAGPVRPASSPTIASSGRCSARTARMAASDARSADVAKSVPSLA